MRKGLAVLLALAMLFALCACGHEHTWTEATCTEPRTCSECGATEGEPLGHDWAEATCTEAKTCKVCGTTEGEPLGHDLAWETKSVDVITAKRTMVSKCSVCGEEIETKEEDLTSFVEDGAFLFTPEEFIQRLQNAWDEQYATTDFPLTFEYSTTSKGTIIFEIRNKNHALLGWGCFFDKDGDSLNVTSASQPIASVMIVAGPISGIEPETLLFLIKSLAGPAATAVDPSIDGKAYEDSISGNLFAHTSDNNDTLNGLYYGCGYNKEDNYMYIRIDIAENVD